MLLMSLDEDEETRILLEKEFDDYYEDHVHKSAGPVVFVSKMLGMIPVIWTEDESESECKSYFNLYTFVIFIGKTRPFCIRCIGVCCTLYFVSGWVGLAAITGLRVNKVDPWPGAAAGGSSLNDTDPIRFITKSSTDTYVVSRSHPNNRPCSIFSVVLIQSYSEESFDDCKDHYGLFMALVLPCRRQSDNRK